MGEIIIGAAPGWVALTTRGRGVRLATPEGDEIGRLDIPTEGALWRAMALGPERFVVVEHQVAAAWVVGLTGEVERLALPAVVRSVDVVARAGAVVLGGEGGTITALRLGDDGSIVADAWTLPSDRAVLSVSADPADGGGISADWAGVRRWSWAGAADPIDIVRFPGADTVLGGSDEPWAQVAIAADGSLAAAALEDGGVLVHDEATGEVVRHEVGRRYASVLSVDAAQLVVGFRDGVVVVSDPRSAGAPQSLHRCNGIARTVFRDGDTLVVVTDDEVRPLN